jgi:hypothetical protein
VLHKGGPVTCRGQGFFVVAVVVVILLISTLALAGGYQLVLVDWLAVGHHTTYPSERDNF